jgi:apolipoprotein N-acyltransferase
VIGVILALAGAVVSVAAFPPFGPGWQIIPGIALFLIGLRRVGTRGRGLLLGALYGLGLFGALIWWISELGLIAVIPLVLSQAAFLTVYGWWLAGYNDRSVRVWYSLAVGGWAAMELVRYHLPFNGLEWGAAGYALSDQVWGREVASWVGVTGLTVLAVAVAAAFLLTRETWTPALIPAAVLFTAAVAAWGTISEAGLQTPYRVAIVQGSTPCPFEHCAPNERLRTFQQHLALTGTIEPGSADLVVWSEGSTGSLNADPVQNPEIGAAVASEARRIGAWFLVGSDRPISDEDWVNANVVFNPDGEIVGEYRKQHPVPFGEYIPFRPLFEWIPELDRVPRDMIPGDGPVVFDVDWGRLGSVISFEGGFSRYARRHVRAGADIIVVATNEGSYGTTPASDQFIGMTRMRAAELGVPVVHAAVTGKSTIIAAGGSLGLTTGLGTQEILRGDVVAGRATLYTRIGDLVIWAGAVTVAVTWWRSRSVVGSQAGISEEE